MPVNKFHRAELTFVLSAGRTPQKSHEALVLFVSATLQRRQHLIMPIEVLHMVISRMATWCSLFYSAVPQLELMQALGNSGHSNARAAGHFQPAILSDCDTVWSVTSHFSSDFVC